jgi:hypothetical protein
VLEANGEERRGEVEAEEQESGALWRGAPLKPHEAVTEGGRNSGWKPSEMVAKPWADRVAGIEFSWDHLHART